MAQQVQSLEQILEEHVCSTPEEEGHREVLLEFVRNHSKPFSRAHLRAHLTASAVVVDSTGTRVLLGYHRKLDRWLQFGGHGEPDDSGPDAVALREVREETGLKTLVFHPEAPRPFDVDVHCIPELRGVPQHNHLDLRYLLTAPDDEIPVRREDEHHALRWFTWDEAVKIAGDESLRRCLVKAQTWIAGSAGTKV